MTRTRVARLVAIGSLLLGAAASVGAVPAGSASRVPAIRTVRCSQSAGVQRSGRDGGNRVVLGVVSVPPLRLPDPTVRDIARAPFSHWHKAGLAIRGSAVPVTVSVPKRWRNRVRILWGDSVDPATALRFQPCAYAGTWFGYPGGFLLRSRSACVPLVVTVGHRRATARFGVGRRC